MSTFTKTHAYEIQFILAVYLLVYNGVPIALTTLLKALVDQYPTGNPGKFTHSRTVVIDSISNKKFTTHGFKTNGLLWWHTVLPVTPIIYPPSTQIDK